MPRNGPAIRGRSVPGSRCDFGSQNLTKGSLRITPRTLQKRYKSLTGHRTSSRCQRTSSKSPSGFGSSSLRSRSELILGAREILKKFASELESKNMLVLKEKNYCYLSLLNLLSVLAHVPRKSFQKTSHKSSNRRWISAEVRGSIDLDSDHLGGLLNINDEKQLTCKRHVPCESA